MVIEAADNITMKTSEFVLEADRTRINSEVVINGGVTQGGGAMSSNGIVVDAHQHTGVLKGGDNRRPGMTLYSGMNNTSGKVITDIDHLRQSVRDILLTPQGSRIARREYGSLLSSLIDQPQNPALRLQVMSAVVRLCQSLGATDGAGFHHHQQQF